MTTTDRAPRWDLETIYPALDDRSFTAALEGIFANVDRLGTLYDDLGIREVEPREERIALVPTVVAHRLAEQARGDSDAQGTRLAAGHDLV